MRCPWQGRVARPQLHTPYNKEDAMTEQKPEVEKKEEHTWIEEIEITGSQMVDRVKELVAEGNVRRVIIRNAEGQSLLEIPLTAGVVVGGAVTLLTPMLAALGAVAGLLARVKIEVVRVDSGEKK
jgi:hypothetical protein